VKVVGATAFKPGGGKGNAKKGIQRGEGQKGSKKLKFQKKGAELLRVTKGRQEPRGGGGDIWGKKESSRKQKEFWKAHGEKERERRSIGWEKRGP